MSVDLAPPQDLSVPIEPDLSPKAVTVLEHRYLMRDDDGRVVETPAELLRRVGKAVARPEDTCSAARGMVLLGAGEPIVLCAVDWIGIANEAHDAFRRALADAAGTTPARVAVHTLHQHDAPECDFGAERILLVTAARPVPGVEQPRQAAPITLSPLTLDQVTALLASLGALRDDLAGDLPRLVLDASGGSPLLALESLHASMDAGLLELHDGVWRSPDAKSTVGRAAH